MTNLVMLNGVDLFHAMSGLYSYSEYEYESLYRETEETQVVLHTDHSD